VTRPLITAASRFVDLMGMPPNRVGHTSDGLSSVLEWELGGRELLVDVDVVGAIDVLLVSNGARVREGSATLDEIPDLGGG